MKVQSTRSRRIAGGITLIEVIVTVAIIGLLAALLLTAVQAARDAARRVHCANNLKQIGIALNAYHATHQLFPAAWTFSLHARILPELGQPALFNALNFAPGMPPLMQVNDTVSRVQIATFLCPADPSRMERHRGRVGYAGNAGVGFGPDHTHLDNGLFLNKAVGLSEITDGTSNTLAMAEWVPGYDEPNGDVAGVIFFTANSLTGPGDLDRFAAECADMPIDHTVRRVGKGTEWLIGGLGFTSYNHTMPIGGRSCANGGLRTQGAFTAGSRHPGGAYALFADGHARFLRATIPIDVWRSLSTRNGAQRNGGSF